MRATPILQGSLLTLLLCGCSSETYIENKTNSLIGSPTARVFQQIGLPDQYYADAPGGHTYLIFKRDAGRTYSGEGPLKARERHGIAGLHVFCSPSPESSLLTACKLNLQLNRDSLCYLVLNGEYVI